MNEPTPFNRDNPQHGGRVLILESDDNLAANIQRALQEAAPQAQASVARNIADAQRLVSSERPDLFVLDMDAARDRGEEFLLDLRTSHPHARAIILTGAQFPAERDRTSGLGAIHFLEKPFPHGDFVTLAETLLARSDTDGGEKFRGTLSDLHIADIVQLKCISGSSSALEFTGPTGEKARVYFEGGQVRHATAPGKEGVAAFNEIVNWPGGKISEVSGASAQTRTIDLDWQVLLMEAVRKMDETRGAQSMNEQGQQGSRRKVLVIDDSLMLLSFVKEMLGSNYAVTTAPTAAEGLAAATADAPDLILLDYVLPDMQGSEVAERLRTNDATAKVPVVYLAGFGTDPQPEQNRGSNVIGTLNKPFTSDLLKRTVEQHMSQQTTSSQADAAPAEGATPPLEESGHVEAVPHPPDAGGSIAETADVAAAAGETVAPWWTAPVSNAPWPETAPESQPEQPAPKADQANFSAKEFAPSEPAPLATNGQQTTDLAPPPPSFEPLPVTGNTFFSGDTSFFSLHWALQTIGKDRLTGVLRCFWDNATVELLARNGEIVLVTTRDPELYCPEAPITLVNVDASQTAAARDEQRNSGCPMFLSLATQGLVLREPGMQLVQHYGQKLFAQLWTAQRVRFVFELMQELPPFANEVPTEADVDQWVLSTLRFLQYQELRETPETDSNRIPAYTRDGYERVQKLRLTVAEAQFASQFNGVRSIAQIAKNLRLDIKFARLTLFRFLALEIVECWPPTAQVKQERRGIFQRLGSAIGLGD